MLPGVRAEPRGRAGVAVLLCALLTSTLAAGSAAAAAPAVSGVAVSAAAPAAIASAPTGAAPTAAAARRSTNAGEAIPGVRLSGGDISWPNCPKGMGIPSRLSEGQPLPVATAAFALIGLTNGPGFTPNPCLAAQVAWASGLWTSAYAMTTYPTALERATYGVSGPWSAIDSIGQLRNAGYAQALVNVAAMAATGLRVPFVWVDVEPYAVAPWSRSIDANREVVRGVVRGYEDSGYRVGFYSYERGWRTVVGAWRKPAYPAWLPVGHSTNGLALASARCASASFSGGEVLLAQWVDANRDQDVTCPQLAGRAAGPTPLTRWIDRRLHKGSHGAAVRALQAAIGARADGTFGKRTRARLVRFQRAHGLAGSGVTGRSTWRALGAGRQLAELPSRLAEVFAPS
jgi:peptidoglycan hydrolase-like protein with peptidoglycan-binding domain